MRGISKVSSEGMITGSMAAQQEWVEATIINISLGDSLLVCMVAGAGVSIEDRASMG